MSAPPSPPPVLAVPASALIEERGLTHLQVLQAMEQYGYRATGNGTLSNLLAGRRRNKRAHLALALVLGIHPDDLQFMTPATVTEDAA